MSTLAAVMTGKGTGAISTIQLFGESAETILKKMFKPAGAETRMFKPGTIRLGTIIDGDRIVDEVVVGCEGVNNFAINCHGNPLIVEAIMKLLKRYGSVPITAEQMLCRIFSAEKATNAIAIEAKLAQNKAKTLQGTSIILNQIDSGLSKTARDRLKNINTISLEEITSAAQSILEAGQTANFFIVGCTIVLVGPTNTGKSTLLNYLCGRQKAIVADVKGTTRDWVSAECQIEPLSVTLIDTAGLYNESVDSVGKISQKKTIQLLEKADLALLVLDNSTVENHIDRRLLGKITGKKIVTILNKSDLPIKFDTAKLPKPLADTVVQISAKFGTGIEKLLQKIKEILGVVNFDLKQPVCFTARQEKLLRKLAGVKSEERAVSTITELLNGAVRV
jgi:tRNA modification GTPase